MRWPPPRGAPRRLDRAVALALVCLAPACAAPGRAGRRQVDGVPYGTVMVDLSRRFELLGRAALAGRFELSEYELGEIEDQVAEALPRAAPPREGHPEVLPALATDFLEKNLPELQQALGTRDPSRVAAAFRRVAEACNGCHQSSGHGFIEVPLVEGRAIPDLDPMGP